MPTMYYVRTLNLPETLFSVAVSRKPTVRALCAHPPRLLSISAISCALTCLSLGKYASTLSTLLSDFLCFKNPFSSISPLFAFLFLPSKPHRFLSVRPILVQGCAVSCNGPVIQETGTLFHETKKYLHFIFLTGSSLFRNTLNQIRN